MVCAALAWLVVPALSSLLFIMIEGMSPLDSFFEAMSGWTGTGLTMIAHPSSLTHTTQFWRSLMQWVGGVGVIVLMLSILASRDRSILIVQSRSTRGENKTEHYIHGEDDMVDLPHFNLLWHTFILLFSLYLD